MINDETMINYYPLFWIFHKYPANIYLFKVNNSRHCNRSGVFIVINKILLKTSISCPLICIRTSACQGVQNLSFMGTYEIYSMYVEL